MISSLNLNCGSEEPLKVDGRDGLESSLYSLNLNCGSEEPLKELRDKAIQCLEGLSVVIPRFPYPALGGSLF